MDDLSEKLSQLFSDPESMEKIKNLAGTFLSDSGRGNTAPEKTEKAEEAVPASTAPASGGSGLSGLSGLAGLDPSILLKITDILGKANTGDDDKLKLLNSIKPYLSDKRADKIDSAVQILKMSKYASVFAKDIDLFHKKEK